MNQTKWLSEFIYDVESTPLLWSFDDPEQDAPLRSQSSPILTELTGSRLYSITNMTEFQWQNWGASENKTARSQSFPDPSLKLRGTKQTSLAVRKRANAEYLEFSKTPVEMLELKNLNEKGNNLEDHLRNEKKDGMEELDVPVFMDGANLPTYIEVKQRESEQRRLLSVVRPFPSYLAISSPEDTEITEYLSDDNEDLCKEDIGVGIIQDGEIITMDVNDKYFEQHSNRSSDNETPNNVEYISGGIWYSDEEEEKAIEKEVKSICAYENPAFVPDASDDEQSAVVEAISYQNSIHKKLGSEDDFNTNDRKPRLRNKTFSREIDSDSAISLDDHSVDESVKTTQHDGDNLLHSLKSASRLEDIGEACEFERLKESISVDSFSVHSTPSSTKLADIVSFDDIASLIEKCKPGGYLSYEEDRTSSSSEFEIISQTSTCSQILSPESPQPDTASSPVSDVSVEADLVWDAYIPPLTLRWSDVMIKQIFDVVEKDNEEYVTHIRQMARSREIRPLNILQRLCWFDEDSGSVQSLVGVFEYNI
uniref:uncharacterized protein LOC120339062 isoform X1 n=2 Tax=Styela clava TaxID=7725 RepID=UPI00193996CA|nr:uncharacterized protein LOC120339062 isoform X1 [Styela clava]XP_039263042.1 uncharacterized protein LOC120339062 isoform X1 [Styela clava]XP_039263043.1 uncharacterized protein LOC120339062 isoform X1 [Styela clava]